MLVFIDESGVHKRDGQSSVVLVCVVIKDLENLVRAYWNDKNNKDAKELYGLASKKITTQLVGGQDTE